MAQTSDRIDYFTKHLFGAGIECPTKLYYKSKDYSESKTSEPFIEHAIYNKRLLKALARSAYPDGIFVDADSVPRASSKTNKLLDQDNVVLFDAIFTHQQMMTRLPIIEKNGDELTLFHIRTKAYKSQKLKLTDRAGRIINKWRRYLLDFAYQAYLVKENWPEAKIRSLLVLPDKKGLSSSDNLPYLLKPFEDNQRPVSVSESNQDLLVKLDVSELLTQVWEDRRFTRDHLPKDTFKESLDYFRELYLNQKKEGPEIGTKCKRCEFRIEQERVQKGTKSGFRECWSKQLDSDEAFNFHVFDLIGPGTNGWIQKKIYDQREIPIEEVFDTQSILKGRGRLSHEMRQALQIHKAHGEEVPEEIFRPPIFKELRRWEYPLHFLDFEAGNYAVPVKKNRPPYHLVVFQFSCHTLHEDGNLIHHQWIDDLQSGYASYELVRKLIKVPGIEEGTIVQYSDFERQALKIIRRELVDEQDEVHDASHLIKWIEEIILRKDSTYHNPPYVADLSRLVKNFYYNREMENSLSIKDVLRSVMSHSGFLMDLYSKPYSSHNFDNIIWWQSDGKGGARNPYHILAETGESPIRRGTEAMVIYGKLIAKDINREELQAYRKALLKYCELDTLAMLMIYQHWKQKMSRNV
jgi:hypothetical protein